MKALILYRPNSEHARAVEEYLHDFERRFPGRKLELMSLDTREGADKAVLYGIMRFPAMLALKDDGQLSKYWDDEQMPLMNEVAGYLT